MKICVFLFASLYAFCQNVQPWQQKSPAMAVRVYIDRALSWDDVVSVRTEVDSTEIDSIALVSVTVNKTDSSDFPIIFLFSFSALADSGVNIVDTTYIKEQHP